jgi:LPS sulfotransferase NodH
MEPKRAIILADQRTGSTLLRRWLNNHPQIRSHGEVFLVKDASPDGVFFFSHGNRLKSLQYDLLANRFLSRIPGNVIVNRLVKQFLHSLYCDPAHSDAMKAGNEKGRYQQQINRDQIRAILFKLMYSQLRRFPYLRKWMLREGISVIHLTRHNTLKKFISQRRSEVMKVAHSDVAIRPIRVTLNPRTLVFELSRLEARQKKVEFFLRHIHHLDVIYEDFVENTFGQWAVIADFLGVKNASPEMPNLKKIGSEIIEDNVKNYDEIKTTLEGTPYASYL